MVKKKIEDGNVELKVYGISDIIQHKDGFNYVVAYLSKQKNDFSIIIAAWDRVTKDLCRFPEAKKKKEKTKIYGISKIIKHPQGVSYVCAFLSEEKTLGCSMMLASWDTKTSDLINFPWRVDETIRISKKTNKRGK